MKPERSIGYEVKTLNNLIFRDLLSVSSRKGLDELTMMHGWIIGYLYHNRDQDIFQKNLEAEFCISRSTVTNILKLISIFEQNEAQLISSHALSEKLGITMRSASRILAKLYDLDMIRFRDTAPDTKTPRQGRPSHYYHFNPSAFKEALL